MKKIYHIISLGIILALVFSSCGDKFGNTLYPDEPLILKTNQSAITLDAATPESDALTFNWTAGTNYGSNAAIKYTFELGLKGTNFKNAVAIHQTQGNIAVNYRMGNLNQLLLTQLGTEAGTEAQLEARVTAYVQAEGIAPQVSEVISLKVKTYKPITTTLYLIGSATPNGWSADKATKMNSVQGSVGQFLWQGKLLPGEYKFITTLGSFAPSYNKGSNENSLYFRESDSDPNDVPFVVAKAATYQIKVDLINRTIQANAITGTVYDALWFVGGFTGWSFQPMTIDVNDPFIFRYHAKLSSTATTDEFKIATTPDFAPNVVFFRPKTNGTGAGTALPVVNWSESQNNADYKWKINNGTYKIKLDLRENTIDIVPFSPYENIYIVGDASPNGWDIGQATPLVKSGDPHIFTWTGTLKVGEFKFSCDKKSDWNGAWFLASKNGLEPTGNAEQMLFSKVGSNPDNKWKISSPGIYNITLDQLKETVTIKKQ